MPKLGPKLDKICDLHSIVDLGYSNKPDEYAVLSQRACLTWRQLNDLSDKLAQTLLAKGLVPGDLFTLLLPNCWEAVVAFCAALKSGTVVFPIYYPFTPRQIDSALLKSAPKLLLAHPSKRRDLAKCENISNLGIEVLYLKYSDEVSLGLEVSKSNIRAVASLPPPCPERPFLILYTSGSTGAPKGVTYNAKNFGTSVQAFIQVFNITDKDTTLNCASLFHLSGLLMVFAGLGAGGKTAVAPSQEQSSIRATINTFHPTFVTSHVKEIYSLLEDHKRKQIDLSSIRILRTAGDKLPETLYDQFILETGIPIFQGYGTTESCILLTNAVEDRRYIGSVGGPYPEVQISIRDKNRREVPQGTVGNLWYKSKATAIGFREGKSYRPLQSVDGWLDSEDLFMEDAEGHYWFRGRAKQIIKFDAESIYPQEVEGVLLSHPEVRSAAVVGVPNSIHGENIAAYVVLKKGHSPVSEQKLISFVKKRIGFKTPHAIKFVDTIELISSGKIDRASLQKKAVVDFPQHSPD
ncbi:class I adenylate-forming enzyme family protein [Flexibacterium corallicola]|uniref:class I adenylate-forming enzyme family protein n=1 Tax=Flexibacterium corallicola TaxID=3037259 RepID=UPI00286F3ACF|nr:class I adenylate-forming enzyme family protein [Pseudovibrio sp. M1P-2-3]